MAPSGRHATPQERINALAYAAVETARKAKKHRMSLGGANFYADKLAQLRTDATNAFRELSNASVGDVSVLAELMESCFSTTTPPRERLAVARELRFQLGTAWSTPVPVRAVGEEDAIFPLALLTKTRRAYLGHVARQMNGCFAMSWFDACAVMMRRLLESSIVEAFETRGLAAKVKTPRGDFFQLTDLVDAALAENSWNLSRNARTALPKLRDVGHMSAHGRYFTAQKSDIEKVQPGCRIAVEEFLRIAGLL